VTKKQFTIPCTSDLHSDSSVELRTIGESDQPTLLAWKNQSRQYFFFKELISESAQREWFGQYLARDDDYMFVVRVKGDSIGCMGIRLITDTWDVYNVILGDLRFAKKGYMYQALHTMCRWAVGQYPVRISAKVLKDNPAIDWYSRNGFRIVSTHLEYVEIEWSNTTPVGDDT